MAFSLQAIVGLIQGKIDAGHWIGLRVLLVLMTVFAIRYFFLPPLNDEAFPHRSPPPQIYANLYLLVLVFSCGATVAAIRCLKMNRVLLSAAFLISMISELWLSFVMMIVARKPESFWKIYEAWSEYDVGLYLIGVVAISFGIYLFFRNRIASAGLFASLTLLMVPVFQRLYEWVAF